MAETLFGPNPYDIRQQRQANTDATARKFAEMNAAQRGAMGMFQGGAGLGRIVGGAMGLVDPVEEEAKATQNAAQGINFEDPKSLRDLAGRLRQIGNLNGAMEIIKRANNIEVTQATAKRAIATDDRAERRLAFEQDEAHGLKVKTQQDAADAKAQAAIDKKEATIAALEQKSENEKRRSEDNRFSIEERAAASRQADATKRMIAGLQNAVQKARVDASILASGSKTDLAAEKKADKQTIKDKYAEGFNTSIDFLEQQYIELNKLGGIVNPQASTISNLGSRIASSFVGQTLGGMVGTKEQKLRDDIMGTIPLLVLDIKNVTGASAQQMNSNIELQNFLRAASDPKTNIETVLVLLKNLKTKYTGAAKGEKSQSPAPKVVKFGDLK